MKKTLLFLLALVTMGLLAGGCASQRATQTDRDLSRAQGTPLSTHFTPRDTTATALSITPSITPAVSAAKTSTGGVLGIFKRAFPSKTIQSSVHNPTPAQVGKCKRCPITINQVAGSQHNEQTTVEKKAQASTNGSTLEAQTKTKGPAATGGSTARDQSGLGVNSEINGDNNKADLHNTPVEALGWKAQLVKSLTSPLGIAISLVALLLFVAYFGPNLLLAYKRRKAAADNAAGK